MLGEKKNPKQQNTYVNVEISGINLKFQLFIQHFWKLRSSK